MNLHMSYLKLKISRFSLVTAVLCAMFVAPGVSHAETAASEWADSDFARARLVSAVKAVGDAKTVTLGLHFRLKKGWKVYWRSPGDAGFPPRINWSKSQNFEKAVLLWPVPKRFSVLGFETLGYKDEVVLPITLTLVNPGQALSLKAIVDYLACSEICIPLRVNLALDLPEGESQPSAFIHLINRYSVRIPGDGAAHGLSIEKAQVLGTAKRAILRVTASAIFTFNKPDLYVEGPDELAFSTPKVVLSEKGRRVTLDLAIDGLEDLEGGLIGKDLTLTFVDGQRFAEKILRVEAAPAGTTLPIPEKKEEKSSLLLIMALAVVGGLILNLMPCVLPVLSIKVLGVISHGGGQRRMVRLSFLASAAGIIVSFLVLAGILAVLKQAGAAVGWGIQFQHPWFLIVMLLVVTLFACNMWGFFEVRLPSWMSGYGAGSGHSQGLGGSFVSGVFAMLLATPCSAPFLGTAIGFAFSYGLTEIFAIFFALGIGLALPFLLLAAMPGFATRLPKPGPWMVKLKKVLGFALAATGLWLLSVLVAQVGFAAAAVIGVLSLLVGVTLYFNRRRGGAVVVVVLATLAFVVPQALPMTPQNQASGGQGATDLSALDKLWTPFDESKIPSLVVQGKVVFVDVTADWCITCIVNKNFVLAKGEAFKRLAAKNVVAMKADWTLPDEVITRYLASFDRYGIPFNAVYGPGAPNGVPLPELLSQELVLNAFKKAAGNKPGS